MINLNYLDVIVCDIGTCVVESRPGHWECESMRIHLLTATTQAFVCAKRDIVVNMQLRVAVLVMGRGSGTTIMITTHRFVLMKIE